MPTETDPKRFLHPGTIARIASLDLRAKHVRLCAGIGRIAREGGGLELLRESVLSSRDLGGCSQLRQHPERLDRIELDNEADPRSIRDLATSACFGSASAISSHTRQRKRLLYRDASVQAHQVERHVVKRSRDDGLLERRDDRR